MLKLTKITIACVTVGAAVLSAALPGFAQRVDDPIVTYRTGRHSSVTEGVDFETRRRGYTSKTITELGTTYRKGKDSITYGRDGAVTERYVNGCRMKTITSFPDGRRDVRRTRVC